MFKLLILTSQVLYSHVPIFLSSSIFVHKSGDPVTLNKSLSPELSHIFILPCLCRCYSSAWNAIPTVLCLASSCLSCSKLTSTKSPVSTKQCCHLFLCPYSCLSVQFSLMPWIALHGDCWLSPPACELSQSRGNDLHSAMSAAPNRWRAGLVAAHNCSQGE